CRIHIVLVIFYFVCILFDRSSSSIGITRITKKGMLFPFLGMSLDKLPSFLLQRRVTLNLKQDTKPGHSSNLNHLLKHLFGSRESANQGKYPHSQLIGRRRNPIDPIRNGEDAPIMPQKLSSPIRTTAHVKKHSQNQLGRFHFCRHEPELHELKNRPGFDHHDPVPPPLASLQHNLQSGIGSNSIITIYSITPQNSYYNTVEELGF
ncbi:hypothetical protein PanWU01x14_134000, partial [Parasponia andersonii]